MKFLITGGAGFIGSYLTSTLNALGHEVYILDKLSIQVHGPDYLNSYLFNTVKDIANVYKEDIVESKALDQLIDTCDVIVHLAAETGTGQSMYEISEYVKSNSFATALILEKMVKRKHHIQKFVLASSRSVYGEGKYKCDDHGEVYPSIRELNNLNNGDFECKCPFCNKTVQVMATNEDSQINPLSIYGITKFNQEQLVLTTCAAIGLPYTIFRFQNVYGKGQSLNNPYTGILAIFSRLILDGKEINVFEDGRESRDFIHVRDIIKAVCLDIFSEAKNQILNVGSGKNTTVLEIVKHLEYYFQHEVKYKVTGSFRIGDIRHNFADISRIIQTLNFKPEIQIENGLKDLLEWVELSHESIRSKSFDESVDEMEKFNLLIKK